MPKIRKRYWIPSAALLLVGSCVLYGSGRYRRHFERDGWVWESSHRRLACPVCTGQMERFEYNGRAIPLPAAAAEPTASGQFLLYTPVGCARVFPGDGQYHPYVWSEHSWPEVSAVITTEELQRGYYDAPDSEDPNSASFWPRKKGTPVYWCLGESSKFVRGLDPSIIDQLEW